MKYIDAFRDGAPAAALWDQIRAWSAALGERPLRIMEVCGTHTMAIARGGLRSRLPANVTLISGPGCPVCVTAGGFIDTAIALAEQGKIIATFGDMMRVPGAGRTLAQCRAEGAAVKVCYSPLEALALARSQPEKEVVFLGVGFETTTGPVLSLVPAAQAAGITNLSILTAFKRVPPALRVLCQSPDIRIDAFLLPAHVSAIIGSEAYRFLVDEFQLPGVVAGFEPLDILLGLSGILELAVKQEAAIVNQYSRVVRPQGNRKVQRLFADYLEGVDAEWRGLGTLPDSGWALRPEFASFDAARRYGLEVPAGKEALGCRCGDVLKGVCTPLECRLFGRACTPRAPIGPCMVSSEGSCAAYYQYEKRGDS